ncbi:hypothetical protein [Amycolatopsis pigmentata]|uniref:Phage integrase family protein n=1 Tax=Amycolatopsis pigmentata TaxID=450801 RepID=A0ABW5FSR0_9PSEU
MLLDYLRRREPELDYSTLDRLSRSLAGLFWAKIEAIAPGQPCPVPDGALRGVIARPADGQANTRVRDLENGEDINVTTAEDLALWEFAAVEVLRHAGIRIEELLELTHLSIRQYQRPNGELIALLVIAPSKTDRERVIPMSAELFAAITRRHAQHGRPIPLIQPYDNHERRMRDPMPFLFQRHTGAVPRAISPATVLVMLRRRCAELAEQRPRPPGNQFHAARLPTGCWPRTW